MYFNNYIHIALYFPLVFVFINILGFTPKSTFFKKFKFLYGFLLLITFVGLLKGVIYGNFLGKDSQYIKDDLLKLLAFVFFIGLPFYILAQREKWIFFFYNYFNIFSFAYTILVSFSLFLSGNVDENGYSIYPGNLFGASTVNLTIISGWCFYSLSQYVITKNKFFLIWTLICYLDVLGSLAKWNFIAIISFPLLISIIINGGSSFSKFQKKMIIGIFCIVCLFFFKNLNTFLQPILQAKGWENFDDFLNGRVFGDVQNTQNLSRAISLGSETGIKDGARLVMWADLIYRTLDNPILGVGLGSRALDHSGLYMEDHNIFVTHLSRYGIPLFILWLWLVILVLKWLQNYLKINNSSKVLLYIFYTIYINFFFQASVGNIWGQNIVVVFIGISIGLLIKKSQNTILSK